MMEVVINEKTTLEKEKRTLALLEEMLKKDTNEKDIKYHTMAVEATKEKIKKLEATIC